MVSRWNEIITIEFFDVSGNIIRLSCRFLHAKSLRTYLAALAVNERSFGVEYIFIQFQVSALLDNPGGMLFPIKEQEVAFFV